MVKKMMQQSIILFDVSWDRFVDVFWWISVAKMEPKVTKKGAKRNPNGANASQKGTKREPTGTQSGPKESKREPKDDQNVSKSRCWKRNAKRARPPLGYILEPFWELKTFKSVELSSISCFFVTLEKIKK